MPLALLEELAVLEGGIDSVRSVLYLDLDWQVFAHVERVVQLALADVAPWTDLEREKRDERGRRKREEMKEDARCPK